MSLQDRVVSLRSKHAALDAELQSENQRPFPNETYITRLKREKLRLKDEMERLSH